MLPIGKEDQEYSLALCIRKVINILLSVFLILRHRKVKKGGFWIQAPKVAREVQL